MNQPREHLPKYYISFIAIVFILVTIPFTVFSVFQARPSSPQAATCYDFNGDGIADVLVGANNEDNDDVNATGAAYIFYGSTSLSTSIDASDADVKLMGEEDDDRFGKFVSGGGDENNDGIDDVIVGA